MKILKILGIGFGGLILLLIAGGFVGRYLLEQDQPQMFGDPVLEESPLPLEIGTRPLLIVYSKTNGYRHRDAIAEGVKLFTQLAEENNWEVVITENSGAFTDANLANTAAIVFNNSTGPVATRTQQDSIQKFLINGGGLMAIHAAGDGSHQTWPWYQDQVIRARFTSAARFPPLQQATITINQPLDQVVSHLPGKWPLTDEWYSFETAPTQVDVLASLNEDSYRAWPFAMGENHPIVWRHENLVGRVLYVGPGHQADTFRNKDYQTLIREALLWVAHRPQ